MFVTLPMSGVRAFLGLHDTTTDGASEGVTGALLESIAQAFGSTRALIARECVAIHDNFRDLDMVGGHDAESSAG